MAEGEGVGGADVVDHVGLGPAAGGEVLHYGLQEETDVGWVHGVEDGERGVDHVDWSEC